MKHILLILLLISLYSCKKETTVPAISHNTYTDTDYCWQQWYYVPISYETSTHKYDSAHAEVQINAKDYVSSNQSVVVYVQKPQWVKIPQYNVYHAGDSLVLSLRGGDIFVDYWGDTSDVRTISKAYMNFKVAIHNP